MTAKTTEHRKTDTTALRQRQAEPTVKTNGNGHKTSETTRVDGKQMVGAMLDVLKNAGTEEARTTAVTYLKKSAGKTEILSTDRETRALFHNQVFDILKNPANIQAYAGAKEVAAYAMSNGAAEVAFGMTIKVTELVDTPESAMKARGVMNAAVDLAKARDSSNLRIRSLTLGYNVIDIREKAAKEAATVNATQLKDAVAKAAKVFNAETETNNLAFLRQSFAGPTEGTRPAA